jgi:hypothetical protein
MFFFLIGYAANIENSTWIKKCFLKITTKNEAQGGGEIP